MLRRVKLTAVRASRGLGLFSLVRDSTWRAQRVSILCYHGVSLADEHEWNPSLYIPPAMFRERLEALRRERYNVLPLGEALDRMYAGTLPPRAVVLTFDDGFTDFHRVAHPLLREFGYPATVYLSTYYCRYNRPPFPVMLSYLLWKGRGQRVRADGVLAGGGMLDLSTDASREATLVGLRRQAEVRGLSGAEKDALLTTVAGRLGLDYGAILASRILHLLSEREVAELSAAGVDIQLHTHRHQLPHAREQFFRELEDNRRVIREITARCATHFCYPNGLHRPEFLGWLSELNIASATTSDPGLASKDAIRLLLPRFVDSARVPAVQFESWLTGVASLLPRSGERVERRRDGRLQALSRISALRSAPALLAFASLAGSALG